jgi:protocatechuate 3,4-dioxygenase beta subunit
MHMMRQWMGVWCLLVLVCGCWGIASEVELHYKVVDQQNKPIAGAAAIIRVLQPETGAVEQEIRQTTGANGMFDAKLELGPRPAYLLINVPGQAVYCIELHGFERVQTHTIHMKPAPAITGMVVDSTGAPVKGATVAVGAIGDGLAYYNTLNRPSMRITTPDLATETAADGSFTLHGVFSSMSPNLALLTATVQRDGKTYWGTAEAKLDSPTRQAQNTVRIVLHPALDIQGFLTDGSTGKPLAGATVSLNQEMVFTGNIPPPVVTGEDGVFLFKDVTHFKNLDLMVSHPQYGSGRAQLVQRDATPPAVSPLAITTSMMPCAQVTGQVLDTATGKPLGPTVLNITAEAC